MELAEINGGHVGKRVTSSLGPLKLRDIKGGKRARKKHDRRNRQPRCMRRNGAAETIGCFWWADRGAPSPRSTWSGAATRCMCCTNTVCPPRPYATRPIYLEITNIEELRIRAGVSPAGMALVPHAAEVLREIVKTFKPRDIAISSYGIREGLLYEQMPQQLRDRDPLIEACRFAEAKDARVRGFGKVDLQFHPCRFSRMSARKRRRLIKAASLLHDVSWRAHPDYRPEVCFRQCHPRQSGRAETFRTGLSWGLALLHRYSNKREGTRFENLYGLDFARNPAPGRDSGQGDAVCRDAVAEQGRRFG